MTVTLAQPNGFCIGIDPAAAVLARAIEQFQAPVHRGHEILHNTGRIERRKVGGARLVENLTEFSIRLPRVSLARRPSPSLTAEKPLPTLASPLQPSIPPGRLPAGHPRVAGIFAQHPRLGMLHWRKMSRRSSLPPARHLPMCPRRYSALRLIEPIIAALEWRFSGGAKSIRYTTPNRQRTGFEVKFRLPSGFVGA